MEWWPPARRSYGSERMMEYWVLVRILSIYNIDVNYETEQRPPKLLRPLWALIENFVGMFDAMHWMCYRFYVKKINPGFSKREWQKAQPTTS